MAMVLPQLSRTLFPNPALSASRCRIRIFRFGVISTKVMNCPACKSTHIQGRGKRHALYPVGILAVVGLPIAMLHQAAAPQLYRCGDCRHDFTRRTLSARIAHLAFILLIVALALAVVIAIGSAVLSSDH